MVSTRVRESKIFLGIFTLLLLVITVNQALAQEFSVSAIFESSRSNLALVSVETPEPAICQYDRTSQPTQTFEQTGDLLHTQRVVVRESFTLYVQCRDLNGQPYEMTTLNLQAPTHSQITANAIASPSSSPNYVYLIGFIFITTLLTYVVTKPKKTPVYSLPSYRRVNTRAGLPEISIQMIQSVLHQAHKEIDTQHFKESLTKYRYLLSLVQSHRTAPGQTHVINQQIQTLYSKLNLYNQLLVAHQQWARNNRGSLQQTLHHIQKNYNTLRHYPSSSLLRNAYKSYAFYEQYLKRAK